MYMYLNMVDFMDVNIPNFSFRSTR